MPSPTTSVSVGDVFPGVHARTSLKPVRQALLLLVGHHYVFPGVHARTSLKRGVELLGDRLVRHAFFRAFTPGPH